MAFSIGVLSRLISFFIAVGLSQRGIPRIALLSSALACTLFFAPQLPAHLSSAFVLLLSAGIETFLLGPSQMGGIIFGNLFIGALLGLMIGAIVYAATLIGHWIESLVRSGSHELQRRELSSSPHPGIYQSIFLLIASAIVFESMIPNILNLLGTSLTIFKVEGTGGWYVTFSQDFGIPFMVAIRAAFTIGLLLALPIITASLGLDIALLFACRFFAGFGDDSVRVSIRIPVIILALSFTVFQFTTYGKIWTAITSDSNRMKASFPIGSSTVN